MVGRRIDLRVGQNIVVKGEYGYIVRIKRGRSTTVYTSEGNREVHYVAVRIKRTREIVFLRLVSNTLNDLVVLPYDEVKHKTNNFHEYYSVDKVTIEVK